MIVLFMALFFFLPTMSFAAAEPLNEIRQLVKDHYVDEVPDSVLAKKTAKEIVESLDIHSAYMTKKEYEDFINGIEQRIVGIGIVLEENKDGVKVVTAIKDGPAFKAGVLPGDIITEVGGASLKGKSVQAAIPLISGKEGTTITLTIRRESAASPIIKTIKRQEIHLPTVEYEMLGGNIGYIRLNSFASDSGREMAEAVEQLNGANGYIVDIRNNGGGYTTAAQEIAGFFPGVDQAFQLREKNKKPAIYPTIDQKMVLNGNVSLLVNAYSASASEMLAVNLKEKHAATLYGQNTYGKGTMQTMYAFPDGSVLKMTTARFYSPTGIQVDKIGVSPDIVTRIEEELQEAHHDQLVAKLAGYRQMPDLHEVAKTKTFTITMNKEMNWSRIGEKSIQLIELGGEVIDVRTVVKDSKTIEVTPRSPLKPGGSYLFIVHPEWQDKSGNTLKTGIYLNVTVK